MTKATPREDRMDRMGRDAFIALYLVGNRFSEQLDRVCQAGGISHPQYSVLWVLCLSESADGIAMGEIADGLLHRAADATRLVDRLVTAGLVSREPSPDDRRVVLVRPTARGREVFESVTVGVKALHREQWKVLDEHELLELTRLLNKALWGVASSSDGSP